MRGWFLLVVLGLTACGGPGAIPEVDLGVHVAVGRTSVTTGEGFPVTVTRIWRKDVEPSPWDDGMLSPLVVRPVETERREDRLRIEEVRRFRAHAFSLEAVTIPPVLFVGRSIGGSGKVIARSEPISLDVVPTLPAEDPGKPELPDIPTPEPERWGWAIGLFLLISLLGRWWWSRRTPQVASPDPAAEAREHLTRLRATEGEPIEDLLLATLWFRRGLGARLQLPAERRTSEELVAALPSAERDTVARLFAPVDRLKFADDRPSAETCRTTVAGMARFLQADGGATA